MGPILHIDMDCFFVAVELLERPDLRGKPVAVGGRPSERGVISTCSYEARKSGVHSGLSSKIALQRCPQLILLEHHFEKYQFFGEIIRNIMSKYSDKMATMGLDEAYLDMSIHGYEKTKELAWKIKNEIKMATDLTASIGIAPSPFLAKIASDWKKPDGFFCLDEINKENFVRFIEELPVRTLPGVGKVTEEKMKKLGLIIVGDLKKKGPLWLQHQFGKFGESLYLYSMGIDQRDMFANSLRQSLSIEHTFMQDLCTRDEWQQAIKELEHDWIERLISWRHHDCEDESEKDLRPLKNIFLKIKLSNFKTHTFSCALDFDWKNIELQDPLQMLAIYQPLIAKLINEAYDKCHGHPIRLLGVGGTFLDKSSEKQLALPLFSA